MSAGRDESTSASPKFSRPSVSGTGTALREATIPESPEDEDQPDKKTTSHTPVPPEVPRRNRAMSSAHLSHFLGSTASAARRSLALRPAPPMPTVTPQFLTVSPAFSVRDQSRSPSPAAPPILSPIGRSPLRSGARHSIDVRNFPSYLQRKRTSLTLGATKILHDLTEGTACSFFFFAFFSSVMSFLFGDFCDFDAKVAKGRNQSQAVHEIQNAKVFISTSCLRELKLDRRRRRRHPHTQVTRLIK